MRKMTPNDKGTKMAKDTLIDPVEKQVKVWTEKNVNKGSKVKAREMSVLDYFMINQMGTQKTCANIFQEIQICH